MSQRHASSIRPCRRARPLRCWSICLLRLSRKTHLHPRLHLQLELDDVRWVRFGEVCRQRRVYARVAGAFSVAERPVRCSLRAVRCTARASALGRASLTPSSPSSSDDCGAQVLPQTTNCTDHRSYCQPRTRPLRETGAHTRAHHRQLHAPAACRVSPSGVRTCRACAETCFPHWSSASAPTLPAARTGR